MSPSFLASAFHALSSRSAAPLLPLRLSSRAQRGICFCLSLFSPLSALASLFCFLVSNFYFLIFPRPFSHPPILQIVACHRGRSSRGCCASSDQFAAQHRQASACCWTTAIPEGARELCQRIAAIRWHNHPQQAIPSTPKVR